MASSEERLRILKMIEGKQITAEEGAGLITALTAAASEKPREEPVPPRLLRVRVTDTATGKPVVNVTIPVGLLDVGIKMGAHFAPSMGGTDLEAVRAAIKAGFQGKLLEAEDLGSRERVEVFAE